MKLTPENFTPAPGRTFEDAARKAQKLARANARPVRPPEPPHYCERARPDATGRLVCPTCHDQVPVAAWWTHYCRPLPTARGTDPEWRPASYEEVMALPRTMPRRRTLPRRRLERVKWTGSDPQACQLCGDPIRFGFTDGKVGSGSWAIMCLMCGLQRATMGQIYERSRNGNFYKVGEVTP